MGPCQKAAVALLVVVSTTGVQAQTQRSEQAVASQADQMLAKSFAAGGISAAPLTNDEDFLRRVSLDLAGVIPTPKEVALFGIDPDPDKRSKLIDRLLDSEGYADLWASYWSEVIFSHATEQRSRSAQGVFEDWMKTQLEANRSWDEIATSLLTATGNTREDGQTALIFAHLGDADELAAEVSRIFLGIQIQCANCHDHPSDVWKREQFHQFAAYFPRISVRRDASTKPAAFHVTSFNGNAPKRDPGERLKQLDRNRDGKVTAVELERNPRLKTLFTRLLARGDLNKDGALSESELKSIPKPNQPGRGSAEHYMPDLQNPTSEGKLMQPVFFVDGSRLKAGASDENRRAALAREITSRGNPWFRKAFVNRVWAELLGEGFTTPVDDMGPGRPAQHEEVLNLLANGFAAHDYDIKWLLRTIANTQAYQRQLALDVEGEETFAGASPTRLRADQIYNSLTQIFEVDDLGGLAGGRRNRQVRGNARRNFHQLFGYDPSTPQTEILGNIPQALFLMNSPAIKSLARGTGDTVLGNILRNNPDDAAALSELYLQVLSREPTEREREIAREHVAEVGDRVEAFEDLFWALLNSSEFLTKR